MKWIAIVVLSVAGCASSSRIERGAWDHLAEADRYEAAGDHYRAQLEREAAQRQFQKAQTRAMNEDRYGIRGF
jgi:hypothetical protein